MKTLNYQRLTALQPTVLKTFTNKLGQEIQLVEHPLKGEDAPVIILYHAEKIAVESEFFDTEDMTAGDDYEPVYMHGQMMMTYECMDYKPGAHGMRGTWT